MESPKFLTDKHLTLVYASQGFCSGILPLGLASISAYLKYYGKFDGISVLDANCQDIYKDFVPPDVVGITAVTQDIGNATRFARFVKERANIPIILGGVHLSTLRQLPEPFDLGVIGEGEVTMLELMSLPDLSPESLRTVKGICFRDGGEVIFTEPRELINDLDTIPLPDRELFNLNYYLQPRNLIPYYTGRTLTMLSSRGCPFNCRFCSTKVHWKKFRAFSAERVVAEMELLIIKYNVEILHIFDDLFIADRKRLLAISKLVKEKGLHRKVKFMCLVRSDMVDDTVMSVLKDMNVVATGAGMESGSDRMLRYLKRDTTTVEMNHHLIELSTRYQIPVMGSFMVGNPEETVEDLQDTLNFMLSHRDNKYFTPLTYIATTFPGTEFWDYAMARNIPVDEYQRIVMDIPSDMNALKDAPLLTNLPLPQFFDLAQQCHQETIYKQKVFGNQFGQD
jgi:Fe-S oxidoreductase